MKKAGTKMINRIIVRISQHQEKILIFRHTNAASEPRISL